MIICSGQGTCSVWKYTYRDYWQNEERVQGEGIETYFDNSAICPMLSNGIQVYFFAGNNISQWYLLYHTFSLSLIIIEWVFSLVAEGVMDWV